MEALKPRAIAPREWAWAAALAAVVMALTTVPYLVALASQTRDWRFGGFLVGVEDGNAYIAKMAQGARGQWLFTPVYTSEPQPGVLLYTFHFLLGKLAGADHAALLIAYHAARLAFGILVLLVSYAFLAEFLPFVRQRRLGLILVALGGGLGWLLVLLGWPGFLGSLPLDFFSPEAYTFLALYSLPHLAASRSLLLLGILAYLRGRPGWAGLAWLGVSLIQPIHVLAMWAVVAVDMLLSWRGSGFRLTTGRAAIAIGLSTPFVLYTIAVFSLNPVLREWNLQSQLPSPHPIHYLLGYGLWIAPGLLGWRVLRRQPSLARWTLAWTVAIPFLIYAPLPIQRRLVEGFQPVLVVLAVLGLTVALRRTRRWLTPLVAGAASLTTAFLLAGGILVTRDPAPPIFHAADQVAVFRWVAAQPDVSGVGLGAYATGNLIPAYTPLVAYMGLSTETTSFAEKRERVAAFYRPETADVERRRLLADGLIRYVFFGPPERTLGAFDPDAVSYLQRRFESGAYSVYEVTP